MKRQQQHKDVQTDSHFSTAVLLLLLAITFSPAPAQTTQEKPVDSLRRAEILADYVTRERGNPTRKKEHTSGRIAIGDLVMRYTAKVIGKKPAQGYPLYIALHGGGGAPPQVNDQQWNHMKVYYRSSVKAGIYVACRGMTNTYNLHSVGASYPAYDRLIENMILFEGVDSNRVYVLGFSAGGDGTYQIATRMPDRWAGANMSAGHPNGLSVRNLRNTPFLLQVGERDRAYNRHRVTAQYGVTLDRLQKQHGGFIHECNIHVGMPHNFGDNDPSMKMRSVLRNPAQWLENAAKSGGTTKRNSNAIAWLDRFTRNPLPGKIIWEPRVGAGQRSTAKIFATRTRDHQRYWLDLAGQDLGNTYGKGELIIARLDRPRNTMIVDACGDKLTILLTQAMLDLQREISVMVDGQTLSIKAIVSSSLLEKTLRERGDPAFMFEAAVTIMKTDGTWTIENRD